MRCSTARVLAGLLSLASAADAGTRPLAVADAIDTTRAMIERNGDAVFVAPDGRRYVVMLVTGDTRRDGLWVELRAGRLDSLDAAAPLSIARFFTRGLGGGYARHGGSYELTWPTVNVPVWIDNERVALYWEDDRDVRQVVTIDVEERKLRFLTDHPTDVVQFAVSPQGTILYGASVPCANARTEDRQRAGGVVLAFDVWELLTGCRGWKRRNYELFASTSTSAPPRRIRVHDGDSVNRVRSRLPAPVFSPNGRWAIVDGTLTSRAVPAGWNQYTREHLRNILKERAELPDGPYAMQLQTLFVVDVKHATSRPLWNAPSNSKVAPKIAWAPDGRSVMIGPVFLPAPSMEPAGLSGEAVAEVEIASGAFHGLPVAADLANRIAALSWAGPRNASITLSDGRVLLAVKRGDGWDVKPESAEPQRRVEGQPVRVTLRQDLNISPAFYARDQASGQERLLIELNPRLQSEFTLGQVQWIEPRLNGNRQWAGRLYYPVDYRQGRRYPLVVHTHSHAAEHEFSLSSQGGAQPALGPGSSVYIAQALANRGIFVLHGALVRPAQTSDSLEQTRLQIAALEEVVQGLVQEGLIERTRVGIMGHSASGWLAAHAISHSSFPYAAAITDDNKDGSYFQASLSGWAMGLGEEMIGAPPFGTGLEAWLEHSPSFNAHRIRTPLLLTVSSAGMELGAWDMFSRLRHLRKPVEYYLVPDLAHGSHGLQNPRQILALQQRALDWWCFWLKDEEDAEPRKLEQYAHWKKLRHLHESNTTGAVD